MKNIIPKIISVMALTALAIAAPSIPASAGDGGKYISAPAPVASPAWGTGVMVRLRGLAVQPDEDGNNITANGAPIVADITIDDSVVPELDLTYFFTQNFAAELILGVTPHDVGGTGVLQGALGQWGAPREQRPGSRIADAQIVLARHDVAPASVDGAVRLSADVDDAPRSAQAPPNSAASAPNTQIKRPEVTSRSARRFRRRRTHWRSVDPPRAPRPRSR